MITNTIRYSGDLAGASMSGAVRRSASSAIRHSVTPPLAMKGVLTTRTSDWAGVITLDVAEHGIAVNNIVDVYHAQGCAPYLTVTNVNGAVITVLRAPSAVGPALPAASTPVALARAVEVDTDFNLVRLVAAGIASVAPCAIAFICNTDDIMTWWLTAAANESTLWLHGCPPELVDTQHVIKAFVSQGDVQVARPVRIGILYNGGGP